jgi:hypothetical protein
MNHANIEYQNEYLGALQQIDHMKNFFSGPKFLDSVKIAFAHQNCVLEGNDLTLADSEILD